MIRPRTVTLDHAPLHPAAGGRCPTDPLYYGSTAGRWAKAGWGHPVGRIGDWLVNHPLHPFWAGVGMLGHGGCEVRAPLPQPFWGWGAACGGELWDLVGGPCGTECGAFSGTGGDGDGERWADGWGSEDVDDIAAIALMTVRIQMKMAPALVAWCFCGDWGPMGGRSWGPDERPEAIQDQIPCPRLSGVEVDFSEVHRNQG